MPGEAVLQYFREKDPRFKDVPDAELTQYVQAKFPEFKNEFVPVRERAQANLKSMESGEAKQQYEQAQASAQSDINTSLGRVAKDVILAGGAALAAPLTAGTSLPVAAAIMAGTGATSSLAAEGVKKIMGSREVANNFKDLAWTVGFDAATFAGGEGFGRALGAFSKSVLPRMVMNSAAKVGRGAAALDEMAERTIYGLEGRLQASVGARGPLARQTLDVDIGQVLSRTEKALQDIPTGRGELGKIADLMPESQAMEGKISRGLEARAATPGLERQLSSAEKKLLKAEKEVASKPQFGYDAAVRQQVRDEAADLVAEVTKHLEAAKGADSTVQPLDALIRIKGKVQQFGYKHPDWREGVIFKDMAENLDSVIRKNLKGSEEKELYEHFNTIVKAKAKASQSIRFANDFMMHTARRAMGSVVGGAVGFEAGGFKGGIAGALAGAAAPQASALILEKTLQKRISRQMLTRGVDLWIQGSSGEARKLASRAFVTAGARQAVEQFLTEGAQ